MTRLRILHLGLGAFHRAHQAVYLQDLIDAGDDRWELAGGHIRREAPDSAAVLLAQGGRYTVETVTPEGRRAYQRIDALRTPVPYTPDLAALCALMADPATRIVSFTVTEAGYDLGSSRPGPTQGHTVYGALTALLRARQHSHAGPVTLLNCDNLRHNVDVVRAGLLQSLLRAGESRLLDWVQAHTTCPNAMVDRITPRVPPDLAARVQIATGFDDGAPVMAEQFRQWVIEDRFCNGRPAWERVGVQMVDSVLPFEEAKIRLLNATHSCIAWAGTLRGYRTIHEAARDGAIRRIAYNYITDDVIPCLQPSPVDLQAYRDTVLDRFCNDALQDTTQRVAADSFAKLPGFIVPTVRERLARRESIDSVAILPALFLTFLRRWHQGELCEPYTDGAMDEDRARAICTSSDTVKAFCRETLLWGPLAGAPPLEIAVRKAMWQVDELVRTD
jgi:D-arabinitol 4-dehydrogenase